MYGQGASVIELLPIEGATSSSPSSGSSDSWESISSKLNSGLWWCDRSAALAMKLSDMSQRSLSSMSLSPGLDITVSLSIDSSSS